MATVPRQDLLTPEPPSAGQDFTFTVGGDERVVLVSAMCELATAAGGSDRGVSLQFKNWNGKRFLVAGTAAAVVPATTQAFAWQSAAGPGVWAVDDAALAGMPEAMLMPMCTVTIHVSNVAAGDQLSNIALLIERYPLNVEGEGPAAFPILDALAELDVAEIAADLHGLRADLQEVGQRLVDESEEMRRARIQRAYLAGTSR